jgi:Cytochrome C'
MHTHARRLAAAALPLALGLALVGSDGGRAADVPRPVSGQMVLVRVEPDELTKYLHGAIREALKVPAPDENAVAKARATALLIASRAQNGRGARDPWQRAALRDNALKVQKALAENKLAAARKQADALLDLSGLPVDPRRVPLKDLVELDEVESLMKPRRRGGLGIGPPTPNGNRDGIELKLIMLARRAPAQAELDAEAAELARAAAVTGAMADLLDAYAPEKKVGNKDPKDWKAQTDEMRAGAADLEAAAKAKDPKRVHTAAARLTASCTTCHEVFRD